MLPTSRFHRLRRELNRRIRIRHRWMVYAAGLLFFVPILVMMWGGVMRGVSARNINLELGFIWIHGITLYCLYQMVRCLTRRAELLRRKEQIDRLSPYRRPERADH